MARTPPTRRAPRPRRAIIIGIVLAVLFGSNIVAYFYTDVLWFQELGITSVLWKSLQTQLLVGLVTGTIVALFVWLNLWIATRSSPVYALLTDQNDPVDQFREAVAPRLRLIRILIALVVGFFTGLFASSGWQSFLLWGNRERWGIEDPQFGRDVSFYVFELPLYDRLLDQVWSAITLVLVLSIATYYLFGAIKPQKGLRGMGAAALAHVSVLLGLLALTKAAQYYLGQFHLNFSPRGVVTGASYTDVNAQLPALRLLAIISIVSAILFLVNIRVRRLSLPLAAVGIWIAVAFLAGGVWPWWVQRFSVEPQEQQREAPYIARNLEATRAAFDLEEQDIVTQSFPASSDLSPQELEASSNLLENVRVWDPGVLQEAYQQLQAIRTYYRFADVDIDRYEIDGRTRQVLLAARELSLADLPDESRNWANLHLQYTHGYGLVASLTNEQTSAGQPSFLVKDVPGTAVEGAESLVADEPKIYFGEGFEPFDFSIVNSRQEEIDYPTEEGVERSSYTGEGGIPLSSIGRRLAFALRETDPNLILSSLITEESRILIYREVRDRVQRAAPFLALDHDPYAAVIDGRLTWILDGYTSTRWYPYSQRFEAGTLVNSPGPGTLDDEINYIRNSVKVTVDARDGTMNFYVVDEEDPLIRVWRSVFPALFTEEEPSEDLQAHFRYPEDLFKIQSEVYLTYHMDDPADFYSKEDEWEIPQSGVPTTTTTTTTTGTTSTTSADVDPTYLLMSLPDETEEEFVLARPFTPRARNNMISMMLARSDPEHYGELRILQFPRQVTVLGPVQINNLINQDVEVSQTLTLLSQEGSETRFGSLLTLPIQDSILYVQPLFITAENEGIPELKRVILVFGEQVVMEESFEEALASLFDLDEPAVVPEPDPGEPGIDPDPRPRPPAGGDAELQRLIGRAASLYDRAQDALADGDFETYGRLIERLGRLLQDAS
jgi:uncharacterized protein